MVLQNTSAHPRTSQSPPDLTAKSHPMLRNPPEPPLSPPRPPIPPLRRTAPRGTHGCGWPSCAGGEGQRRRGSRPGGGHRGPHRRGGGGDGGGLRASQSCTPPSRPRRTPAPQRALRGGNGPSPPLPPTSLPTGSSPGPAAAPSPLCFPPHPPRHPVPVLTSERGEEAEDAEQRHGGGPLPPPVPVPVPLPRRCPRCCPRSPRCWSRRRRRRRRPGRGGPGREAVPCAVPGPPRAAPLRRRQRRRQRGRGRSAPAPPPPGAPGWGAGGGGHREPGRVREPGSSRCPPQPPPLCAGSVPAGPGGERGPAALRSGPDPREGPARTGGTDLRDPQTGTPQAPPPHLTPPPNP